MPDFRKYPSIENSYREKEISWWLGHYPELAVCQFGAQHKMDGSNLQFHDWNNGMGSNVDVFSRNQFINPDMNFQGFSQPVLLELANPVLTALRTVMDGRCFRVYGELTHPKILRRINYGPDVKFTVFDVVVEIDRGGRLPDFMYDYEVDVNTMCDFNTGEDKVFESWTVPPMVLLSLFEDLKIDQYLVETDMVYGLKAALDYEVEGKTFPSIVDGGQCEGVVLKPWNKMFLNADGSPFYLKKKAQAFQETARAPKVKPEGHEGVALLNHEFVTEYLTQSRLDGIFSKIGRITERGQMGEYIKAFVNDAWEDFVKDHDFPITMTDTDFKNIRRDNGAAAKMLMASF